MPVPMIEVIRSDQTESVHYGDLVVVNQKGQILLEVGSAERKTYMRSTAKPFQALPVLSSGAYEKFGLSEKELAIACGSHYAEDTHLNVVRSILKKIGCSEDDLQCGVTPPLKQERAFEVAKTGSAFTPLHSDCSGKHAAMLAVCKAKQWSVENYTQTDHPLQKEIKILISEFTDIPEQNLIIGTDGCTVPTFYISIFHLAYAYSRFVSFDSEKTQSSGLTKKIFYAMIRHPEMVAGTDAFCTALIRAGNGRWIGKIGAEGVYAVGIPEKGIGIALKITDGNMEVIPPVILDAMRRLDLLTGKEIRELEPFIKPPVYDDRGRKVGFMKSVIGNR